VIYHLKLFTFLSRLGGKPFIALKVRLKVRMLLNPHSYAIEIIESWVVLISFSAASTRTLPRYELKLVPEYFANSLEK